MTKTISIKKEIEENDILLMFVPGNFYHERVGDIILASQKMFSRICCVSLNRPCETVASMLKKSEADIEKIIFIDCTTSNFSRPKTGINVFYVSSPKALTELSIAINKAITKEKAKVLVFDSLCTLLLYEQPSTVIKFSHSVISRLRENKVKGVFICLRDDIKSELFKDISMFVDKIVEVD